MQSGYIHAIETMGLVDGPGIRVVVFFQGCALKCKFCHNPDSQNISGGTKMTTKQIMDKIIRFKPYFERSGGGVTFSGGEPLLQKDFLIELLKECKKQNIHTCIDTAGVGTNGYDEILAYTDLVLYDVKALTNEQYEYICGHKINETTKFQEALKRCKNRTIVRQVVIPGINDSDEYMEKLLKYIRENLPYTTAVELLPYHKLGSHKYSTLGIPDPLADVPAMDSKITKQLWDKYFKQLGENHDK